MTTYSAVALWVKKGSEKRKMSPPFLPNMAYESNPSLLSFAT